MNKMPKKQLVDLAVSYRHRTSMAVLVNDGHKEVWIPRSLAEFDPDPFSEGGPAFLDGVMTVTVPEWFAKKEGLI